MSDDDLLSRMRRVLSSMPDGIGSLADDSGNTIISGSRGHGEAKSFPRAESVETAFSQAVSSLVVAGDHLLGMERVLTFPLMNFAPWTLARGALEALCTSAWLFDHGIDVRQRVERSLSLRLRDLQDQANLLESESEAIKQQLGGQEALNHVRERIEVVVAQGRELRLPIKRTKKGVVVGFGSGIPSATTLAEITLGESATFRLLSAVAHQRNWAKLSVGFKRVPGKKNAMTQDMNPIAFAFLVRKPIEWYARVSWAEADMFGWELKRLSALLEDQFEKAGIPEDRWFWQRRRRCLHDS